DDHLARETGLAQRLRGAITVLDVQVRGALVHQRKRSPMARDPARCEGSTIGECHGMKSIAKGFTVVFVPGIILLVLIFVLATNDDSSGSNSQSTTAAEPATTAEP